MKGIAITFDHPPRQYNAGALPARVECFPAYVVEYVDTILCTIYLRFPEKIELRDSSLWLDFGNVQMLLTPRTKGVTGITVFF